MFRTLKLRGQPGKAETEVFERLRDAQDLLATHVQTLVLSTIPSPPVLCCSLKNS